MEERKERANAEQTGQCMREEVEEKVRKGRIYEKEKGKEGDGRGEEGRGEDGGRKEGREERGKEGKRLSV